MRVAVVDGVGSGRWLTRGLTDRGAECVHVKSRPMLQPHLEAAFRPDGYALDLGYDHDIGRLATRLRNLGVVWITAGHASGVPTAEALARLIGLPGDDPATAGARRDRQAMARRLIEAGLDAPSGIEAGSPEEAAAWFAKAGLGTVGAVVRPGRTAAAEGADGPDRTERPGPPGRPAWSEWSERLERLERRERPKRPEPPERPVEGAWPSQAWFCASAAEVRVAVATVLGGAGPQDEAGVFGGAHRTALVQERLPGPEFSVDTVSIDGEHLIAETWRHTLRTTPSGMPLADYDEPADPRAAEIAELHGYVLRTLDALGIRHGAAHSRVVLTPRGPVLVDPGPGLAEGVLPWVAEKFLGHSHAGLLAESITGPGEALRYAARPPEPWPEPIRRVALINRRPGTVRPSAHWAGVLEALPTAIAVAAAAGAGMDLPATRDPATSPGAVYLSASDPAPIERDYLTIREWEQQGPYTA